MKIDRKRIVELAQLAIFVFIASFFVYIWATAYFLIGWK
jgi:hypothetical protein